MQTVERQVIRKVRPEDIERVSIIEQECFKDPYPSYFLSELARDNPETFLIVSLDNEIVGYAVIDRWHDHDHLISIAIVPASRRKHLAEALLTELEKRLAKDRPLRLEVRQSNQAAIQLYLKKDYARIGLVEGYYTDGEDAIVMEKTPVKEALVEQP